MKAIWAAENKTFGMFACDKAMPESVFVFFPLLIYLCSSWIMCFGMKSII